MKTINFTILACSFASITSAADPNAVEPRQANSPGFYAALQPIRTLPTIAIEETSAVFSILPVSEPTNIGGGGGSSTRSKRPTSTSATGTGNGNGNGAGAGVGSIRPSSTTTPRTTTSGGGSGGPSSTARPTATGGGGVGGGAGVGAVGGAGGGGSAGNGPALVSSTRGPTGTVTTAGVGAGAGPGASGVVYVPESGASSFRRLSGAGAVLLGTMLVMLAT